MRRTGLVFYNRRRQGVFRQRPREPYYRSRRRVQEYAFPSVPARELTPGMNVFVDWDGNGDFTGGMDDVTPDLLRRVDLTISYGRDQERALSPVGPGEAGFALNNVSRDYSPDNTSSPLYPNVLGGKEVLIKWDYEPSPINMFRGFIGDDFEVHPDKNERMVTIDAIDVLNLLKDTKISTPLYTAISTGQAIGYILDQIGWPEDQRDIDAGSSTLRYWWLLDEDAWEALQAVINAEGPGSLFTADGDGNFVFRDRNHKATRAASITSQATWTAGSTEPSFVKDGFEYHHGWRDVINHVTFSVEEREPADDASVIWESETTYPLATSETLTLTFVAEDPFLEGSVAVTDWTGTSLTIDDLSGDDGSPRRTLSITATGGPAVISKIEVSGRPVQVSRTVAVELSDTASIEKYRKKKTYPGESTWMSIADAETIAQIILLQRAERLPILRVTFKSGNSTDQFTATRLEQQLTRDLSDRVTVEETETGVSGEFFVEKISHTWSSHHELLETTFGLEAVVEVDDPDTVFILGDSINGVLGTGTLAY